MKKIIIGKFGAPVGLNGEIKIILIDKQSPNLRENITLYSEDGESFKISEKRIAKGMPVVKIDGLSDRNQVRHLTSKEIYIAEEDMAKLPKGHFYIKDIIGLTVYDEEGRNIGKVKDILTNTAQNVYLIENEGKEFMVPGVKEFIKSIDIDAQKVIIKVIEGLIQV